MDSAVFLITGIMFFVIAYFIYGRFLSKLFDISENRTLPSHLLGDGVDYVPTKFPVLFGHHFASIAGAGPIVGPVFAAYFGWLPAVLWIIFGCIFIGGVHDFAALVISARNNGRSIGYVVEKHLGFTGRQVFLIFTFAALILVVAIFAILIAKICISIPAVLTSSFLFILMAPFFGYLVYKKNLSIVPGSLIFVPLLFIFVGVGIYFPINIHELLGTSPHISFMIVTAILLIYCFVASVLPVWLLLQPRDYLSSYLLYAMLLLCICSIFFVAPDFEMSVFTGWHETPFHGGKMSLFPMLFVVVACGACSGFHSLVSSGTTSKQVSSERDMLRIGYGAMLVEGVVALIAVISVAVLTDVEFKEMMMTTTPVNVFANGLAHMASKLGISMKLATVFISLTVSAFMLTTLDTATRLARLTWQELFLKEKGGKENVSKKSAFIANNYVATAICVIVAGYLAFSGDASDVWPVFGASNQLLASLALLTVTLYLIGKKANFWVTIIPTAFMLVTSLWALVLLFVNNLHKNVPIVIITAFLIIMALLLTFKAIVSIYFKEKEVHTG